MRPREEGGQREEEMRGGGRREGEKEGKRGKRGERGEGGQREGRGGGEKGGKGEQERGRGTENDAPSIPVRYSPSSTHSAGSAGQTVTAVAF